MAAAALTLALVSCKNEPAKEPQLQQNMKYPVALSLEGNKSGALRATYQSSSLSASAANERAIENLTVVVFTNDGANNTPVAVEKVITYDKLEKTSGSDPYQGEYKFDMGMAGTFQMEVVANAYMNDTEKTAFLDNLKQGLSYEQFKEVVSARALPQHSETGFAMLSTEPVKVTTEEGVPCHAGVIKLRRLACRFDVFNKLTEENLKLTKVTLLNQITKSYLLPQNEVPAGADGGAKEYTANSDWFNDHLVTGGIYSYENPQKDPQKGATMLLLEGTYNGEAWQKTIVFRKDGRFINTQRNHIYRVHLTKGNGTTPGGGDNGGGKDDPANADKINYVIEVLDWDEDASLDYTDDDIWQAEKRINPLAYVAEYNINPEGTGFVTDKYATNVSGYYDFDTAVAKFSSFELDKVKYHLPSFDELKAIIPFNANNTFTRIPLTTPIDASSLSEEVVLAKKSMVCRQDFKGSGNNVCYALRFKGTEYQSAWMYECVKEGEFQVMRITSRNVTDGVTIAKVATPEFWQQNNSADIVRIFPASGYNLKGNGNVSSDWNGTAALFWTSTPFVNKYGDGAFYFGFSIKKPESTAYVASYVDKRSYGQTIRLFKDTLE